MAVVVAGGAGFLGSHLVDRLARETEVVVFDNMSTGRLANLEHALKSEKTVLAYVDLTQVAETLDDVLARATSETITHIYHFAAASGRPDRTDRPWTSLTVDGFATMQLLKLAERHRARFTFASVDASVDEDDEGKRFAEALTLAARTELGVDARIVRLAECYGPRMLLDGQGVMAALLRAVAADAPPLVPARASERRALTYVTDAIDGIESLARTPVAKAPLVTLVSRADRSVAEIVELFSRAAALHGEAVYAGREAVRPASAPEVDDAHDRGAAGEFEWQPRIGVDAGIERTCAWFRAAARHHAHV
jgi:nucleoside-diphosphate-sugar epimerase